MDSGGDSKVLCQSYNSVMHSTRGYSVQHHKAQQGLVTVAIGGRFDTGEEKYKKVKASCQCSLPYNLFNLKIANQAIKRDLKLEKVYVVDINAI
jgi:hypothetical protein